MKLYLSSYRTGNHTEELEKWIEENGKDILVITNAVDVYPDGERKMSGIKSISFFKNINKIHNI